MVINTNEIFQVAVIHFSNVLQHLIIKYHNHPEVHNSYQESWIKSTKVFEISSRVSIIFTW